MHHLELKSYRRFENRIIGVRREGSQIQHSLKIGLTFCMAPSREQNDYCFMGYTACIYRYEMKSSLSKEIPMSEEGLEVDHTLDKSAILL